MYLINGMLRNLTFDQESFLIRTDITHILVFSLQGIVDIFTSIFGQRDFWKGNKEFI